MQTLINEIIRQQREYTEKTLAEIITKYDFIVGSKECMAQLMEVLPKGANIIYTPYVDNPMMIYAVKKFDIRDWLTEPQKSEGKNANSD